MKILAPNRKKFTKQIYQKMAELAVFQEDERLELIKGEIIEMSPVGLRHAACVKRLNNLFMKKLGDQVIVGVQDPIQLKDDSEPQPDLVLLKYRPDFYESEPPKPADILLLVELADSSIEYDRNVKIPLYAENKIDEVWLIDLNNNRLEIYQNPFLNYYQNIQELSFINYDKMGELFNI